MSKNIRSLEKFILPSEKWLCVSERNRLVKLWNNGIRVVESGSKKGYILVDKKNKKPLFFKGIDEAERGMLHMLDFYFKDFVDERKRLGEILSINEIQTTVSSLHDKALLGKSINQMDEELIDEEIHRAEVILHNSRNIIKLSLCEKFENLESFIDSLSRFNPGASAAKLVLMAKQVKMRKEEVERIIKWSSEKKLILLEEHLMIKSQIEQALNRVRFLYNRPRWIEKEEALVSYCSYLEKLLRSVWVMPCMIETEKVIGLLRHISDRKNTRSMHMKRFLIKSIGNTLEELIKG